MLLERQSALREVRFKGVADIVTDADLASERLIRQLILATFPEHVILGEEGGSVGTGRSPHRWIVDPLDGTTNYAHGFPFFSVSVAYEAHGQVQVGAVYDPLRDELFLAQRGRGASLNGVPIQVSAEERLDRSLLATGFPYEREGLPGAVAAFSYLSHRSMAVRRAGSAALDLCYVACGRLDGYWEHVVGAWDVAAGALLVEEAGGRVTRVDGSPFNVACGQVLSSNGTLHPALVACLGEVHMAQAGQRT